MAVHIVPGYLSFACERRPGRIVGRQLALRLHGHIFVWTFSHGPYDG